MDHLDAILKAVGNIEGHVVSRVYLEVESSIKDLLALRNYYLGLTGFDEPLKCYYLHTQNHYESNLNQSLHPFLHRSPQSGYIPIRFIMFNSFSHPPTNNQQYTFSANTYQFPHFSIDTNRPLFNFPTNNANTDDQIIAGTVTIIENADDI